MKCSLPPEEFSLPAEQCSSDAIAYDEIRTIKLRKNFVHLALVSPSMP
ncbi:MAG TPA: hypothetical protein VGT41_06715 [Candidatus Babeliales bacterium]|nr:hypothetical protein [Candidatus Babeliales bacterium]